MLEGRRGLGSPPAQVGAGGEGASPRQREEPSWGLRAASEPLGDARAEQ